MRTKRKGADSGNVGQKKKKKERRRRKSGNGC